MDELLLREIILNYFDKGDWNYQHTLAAAYWMKKLIEKEGGNENVLITTMYLHDIGYNIKGDATLAERLEKKKTHMLIGAQEARKILPEKNYTKEEVEEIAHLISVHDKLSELKTKNEILVMEADSLAQIDNEKVSRTFNKTDFSNYMEHFKRERATRFKTNTGKKYLAELLMKLEI